MKRRIALFMLVLGLAGAMAAYGQQTAGGASAKGKARAAAKTKGKGPSKGKRTAPKAQVEAEGWTPLFAADLSDADFPAGKWTVDREGVLTASEDEPIWTRKQYENFALELEFKTAEGTNSGVFVYNSNSDPKDWISNMVEIQIADDYAEKWAKKPATWHCGAIFGHLAPIKSMVKKPGEWNRMQIVCQGPLITVTLNGEPVARMNMKKWTSGTTNPDGSPIPRQQPRPFAELPTKGRIGFQGKHGKPVSSPIWFRNVKIKPLVDR